MDSILKYVCRNIFYVQPYDVPIVDPELFYPLFDQINFRAQPCTRRIMSLRKNMNACINLRMKKFHQLFHAELFFNVHAPC